MKQDSPLRNLCERVYTEQYGEAPVVETVHAGLECGLFAEKVPDFDMVSFVLIFWIFILLVKEQKFHLLKELGNFS